MKSQNNILPKSKGLSPKWLIYLGVAAIVLATLIAYLPAIRGGFIWVDDSYVHKNPVLESPSGLVKIWALRVVSKADGKRYISGYTEQYYPMIFTSFWLESRVWGNQNPTGFHVVNVLLHIANALLVWVICRRLGFGWAYLAAVIYALHPVAVESVAWITERKNTLSGLFYLLSVLWYLRFDKTGRKVFYFASLGGFILALFSKTATCTLPAILLLLLWMRHRRIPWADVLRMIPFFIVGAVLAWFTVHYEYHSVGVANLGWQIDFWRRWVIAGRAVFFYAIKVLWPVNLSHIYPRWNPDEFSWLGLLWPTAVIGLTVGLWAWRKSIGRGPLVAWAGFIVTLFPTLSFFNVYYFHYSFVADHFQYLALLFLLVLFVGLGHSLYKRLCSFKINIPPSAPVILSSIIVLWLGYLTYADARMYDGLESLWEATIEKNPKAWVAWSNQGNLYLAKGDHKGAIRNYNKAIALDPKNAKAYNNRALAYSGMGENERAMRDFDQALELGSGYSAAYRNRGLLHVTMGNYGQGLRDLDQAIALKPKNAQFYHVRGNAYQAKGELDRAIDDYNQALRLAPRMTEAYNNRGFAYSSQGQLDRAIGDYNKGIELNPKNADAYFNRGNAYGNKGELDHAIRDFSMAIELNPKYAKAYNNRGVAYSNQGEHAKAIRDFEKALRLARASGDRELTKEFQGNLELYKANRSDPKSN